MQFRKELITLIKRILTKKTEKNKIEYPSQHRHLFLLKIIQGIISEIFGWTTAPCRFWDRMERSGQVILIGDIAKGS